VSPGLDRQRARTLAGGESPPLDEAAPRACVLKVLRSEPEREDYRELPAMMMEAGVVSAVRHREADE
jgi:CHASE2 domain-containing sensor protein